MIGFRYFEDAEEWLAPLDYIAFWDAVAPYNLGLMDRDDCDGLIAGGKTTTALVLEALKFLAVMELRDMFGLEHRVIEPPYTEYLMSVH